jgi:tRNA G18 (ribose-2'-O)-methylase SpoU
MIKSLHRISSLALPELEPYRTLRRPLEHLLQGIFVAESEKVVLRLLESSVQPVSILLSEDWLERHKGIIEANRFPIDIFVGEKELLESIVGHRLHQSIMAVAKVPKPLTITDILATQNQNALYVLVEGITNAENMGVIIRNCVCFSVDAVIILPSSCDPYLRRSVRNSMGNIFKMPIAYISNMKDEIENIKRSGVTVYAAHPDARSRDIRDVRFDTKSCIVLGAEGNGISVELLHLCDEFVAIPMKEGVDSLNVASASAVILWEARREGEAQMPDDRL